MALSRKWKFVLPVCVITHALSFSFSYADEVVFETQLPGTPGGGGPLEFLEGLWVWGITISAVLAFLVVIILLAKKASNPDSTAANQSFRQGTKRAVIGILLIAGGGLAVGRTINPDINEISLPTLRRIPREAVQEFAGPEVDAEIEKTIGEFCRPGSSCISAGNQHSGDNNTILDRIRPYLTGKAKLDVKAGVKLSGVREGVLTEAVGMANLCNCEILITSGTDSSVHRQGTYSHYNGYKLDLRLTPDLTSYVEKNLVRVGPRGDGAIQYVNPTTGAIWAKEDNHWDIVVRK